MAVSAYAGRLEAQSSPSTAQTSASATKPQSDKAGLAQNQRSQLQQASKLAGAGKYDAAMVIYRRIFGTHPPAGDWALAYYDTEAATDDGRPHAIAGLRALLDQDPGNSRYRIALGRALTRDPATREEGREYLANFPKDQQAAEALRQSLLWDAANPAMAPVIRAYLTTHNDPQLAAVMQMTQAPPKGTAAVTAAQIPSRSGVSADGSPLDAPSANSTPPVVNPKPLTTVEQAPSRAAAPSPNANADTSVARIRAAAETAAYQALNASRMEEAEKRFKAILATDPGDSQALAGMGYVRMQQGNFMGAISFLEQATRNNSADKGLAEALETSRFWFIMSEGQQALSDNDLTTAEKRYRSALDLRPNSAEALNGLGGTLLKAQQPTSAIPIFEHAVQAQSASAEGWRGLFIAQYEAGNAALALATDKRIPAVPDLQLMNDPPFLQALASAYSAVGRSGEAQTTLENALKLIFAPNAKGLRRTIQIQLAGLLVAANHLEPAAAIYAQVLADDKGNAAAWQGLVGVQHTMGNDQEALKTIQSMPPDLYATAMRDSGFEVTVASVYQADKKLDVAKDMLQKAVAEQTNAGQKPAPAIQMELARVYADQGSPQLAYPIYQQVLRENPERADAWAGLLSALHVTGHDKEVVEQLKLIPQSVRAQLETNASYLQTMAAVYGTLGRSREATMFLGRVEQGYAAQRSSPPADMEIQNARLLYNGMDDAGLYRELMSLGGRTDLTEEQRRTLQTIWTNWAVRRANQAAAVGNPRTALAILDAAMRAFPDNPVAIKALAIGYSQAGLPHQAVQIYKTQNMASGSAADYEAAVGAALADGDNKDAEVWLRYALAAYPADPQILILGAKFEQARGDTARAMKYYRASLKAMPPPTVGTRLPTESKAAAAPTPLNLPNADQPQPLSVLLEPGGADFVSPATAPSEPYPPSSGAQAPLPPYDGSSRVVPPYVTNSGGEGEGSGSKDQADHASTTPATASPAGQMKASSTVRSATSQPRPQTEPAAAPASGQAAALASTPPPPSASSEALSRPDVVSVVPSQPAATNTERRTGPTSAVPVQLGSNTSHPEPQQTEVTDVLPTVRYAPSARDDRAAAAQPDVAAARAARIRRLQADSAAGKTSQSQPPSEEPVTATTQDAQYTPQPQVAQPSAPPTGQFGNIPDTGAQQYPQPRTPPAPNVNTRSRPVAPTSPSTLAAAASSTVVPPPGPVVPPSAPPVATNPALPAAGAGSLNPPVGPVYPIPPPPTDAELRARNLPSLRGYFEAQAPLPLTPRQQAESELAALEGSYSGWAGATGIGRYRSGTAGLDRLYGVESPVEASAVIGKLVRLTAIAEPVFLNSGVLSASSFGTTNVPYIGTLPGNAANAPAQQFSNGIGGELQLTAKNIGLAVGYTPYEFLVRNVTGRFSWSTLSGHVSLFGERQPVKDTQLSYAGLYDPGTSSTVSRPIWGGVVSTTGGARLEFASGNSSFYVSGDGGILTGQHVLDNSRFEGTAGATFRVRNWTDVGKLTIGGALSGMHYAHNEAGLSYGQGGYFSPDSYFLAAVPASFNGHSGANFHYIVEGALGVQTFRQNEAPFYPLDPSLQSSFVPPSGVTCSATQAPSINCGEYPVTVITSFNYAVHAQASYRFADRWFGGGFVLANNANNYNAVSAGFFLRYVFRAQHSPEGYPAGLFQIDGLRPLQIP